VAVILCALALTDIAHGESDVRLEWFAVRASLLVITTFIVTALATLAKVRRAGGEGFLRTGTGEPAV
jgi:hypothetical protein